MTRRAAIEAMVERAMERATADIAGALSFAIEVEFEDGTKRVWTMPIKPPRLTPKQKREKANAYMRAYAARKKAEKLPRPA